MSSVPREVVYVSRPLSARGFTTSSERAPSSMPAGGGSFPLSAPARSPSVASPRSVPRAPLIFLPATHSCIKMRNAYRNGVDMLQSITTPIASFAPTCTPTHEITVPSTNPQRPASVFCLRVAAAIHFPTAVRPMRPMINAMQHVVPVPTTSQKPTTVPKANAHIPDSNTVNV